MQGQQSVWQEQGGWRHTEPAPVPADLVFVFGERRWLRPELLDEVRHRHPGAFLFGCSTAGQIAGASVVDDAVVTTALHFDHATVRTAVAPVPGPAASRAAGQALAHELAGPGLAHVLVLSDGLSVNGTALVAGLREGLGDLVSISGGLSADGADFATTVVIAGDQVASGIVAAVGLYSQSLAVACGSLGGWEPFGPERIITRSAGNVLHELDGRSALGLYREYLGSHADGLPATGLLFPLSIRPESGGESVVRTILAIDDQAQTMTFAGDVPVGGVARLMRASNDRLIDGAARAARTSVTGIPGAAGFGLLVSCVGRKLLLKQRTEEEVEAVRDALGADPVLTGFYSYGEISPFSPVAPCELHNQTMTVTVMREG